MTEELWRPVPGWSGYYEVSTHGRVRSLDRIDAIGRAVSGRMMRPNRRRSGYWSLALQADGRRESWLLHRLVAATWLRPAEPREEVEHLDGDRGNNRVENLAYRWPTERVYETVQRFPDKSARLTHDAVLDIREARARGEDRETVAARHGITVQSVDRIARYDRYRHVGGPRTERHRKGVWRGRVRAKVPR